MIHPMNHRNTLIEITYMKIPSFLLTSILCFIGIGLGYSQVNETNQSGHDIFQFPQAESLLSKDLLKSDTRQIEIPVTQNSSLTFSIKEKQTTVLESGKYAGHRNYSLSCIDNPSLNGYLYSSPTGVFITLYENGKLTTITPTKKGSTLYKREVGSQSEWVCGNSIAEHIKEDIGEENPSKLNLIQHGTELITYRIAIAVTGEYYFANGNNDTDVMSWVNFAINGVSAIFKNDVSVEYDLALVELFDDSSTDPFTPDQAGGDPRTTQAQTVISSLFDDDDYDIGHVLHNHFEDVNGGVVGWSNGGIARLRSICFNGFKAAAWSGAFFNNNNGFISLTAHEFGHQFGAEHTWNGEGSSCTPEAISETAAYEIASGTTIMSYQGICQADNNIPSSGAADLYFHVHSIIQMIEVIESRGCGTRTDLGNQPPNSDANPCGSTHSIPLNTPFILNGEGSDPNGDAITYCWEQYDEDGPGSPSQGDIGVDAANDPVAPIYRSFPPTTSPTRYIPRLSDVLSNTVSDYEILSRRPRTTTMRLTVRDNNSDNGGIAIDEVVINVDNNGPLLVMPFGVPDMVAGEETNIIWRVNGTEDLCSTVDILLSTDGGNTFNIPLATGVPYADDDTSQNEELLVTIPDGVQATDQARIMVVCTDSDCVQFYDVSNVDADITSFCENTPSALCITDPITADVGDPVLDLDDTFSFGTVTDNITSVWGDDSLGPLVRIGLDGDCDQFVQNIERDILSFQVTETGTYTFTVPVPDGIARYVSIHSNQGFNATNLCPSFLGSNTFENPGDPGGGSILFESTFTLELDACVEYRAVSFAFTLGIPNPPETVALEYLVDGPGQIVRPMNSGVDYAYTFIAINQTTNTILGFSDVADFTTLPGGEYEVYGVSYKSSGLEPPVNQTPSNWIGQEFGEVLAAGGCLLRSDNFRVLSITGGCSILSVTATEFEDCMADETVDIEIEIFYDNEPTTGTLDVNGELFAMTGSPQIVTLTGVASDGSSLPLDVSVVEDQTCIFTGDAVIVELPSIQPEIDQVLVTDATGCTTEDGIIEISMLNSGAFTYVLLEGPTEIQSNDTGLFNNVAPGFYMVEARSDGGCVDDNSNSLIFLFETNTLVATIDPSTTAFCENMVEPLVVETSNPAISYEWVDNNTGTVLSNDPTYTPSESGFYVVNVEDNDGCSSSAFVDVTINESPDVSLPEDTAICQFDDFVLETTNIPATFLWTFNGDPIENSNAPSIIVSDPGEYIVSVSSLSTECIGTDTFNLSLIAAPVFELGEDQLECAGTEISYDVSDDVFIINPEYTWTGPDGNILGNTAQITFNGSEGSGTYTLTVLDSDTNCDFSDSVELEFVDTPEIILDQQEAVFCEGESVTIIAQTGFSDISWTFNGDTLIDVTDFFVTIDQAGELIGTVGIGDCVASDTSQITVSNLPVALIGANVAIGAGGVIVSCEGSSIELDASNETDLFEWSINGDVVEEDGDDEFTATIAGEYIAEVTNLAGCTNADTVTVVLNPVFPIELGNDTIVCSPDDGFTIIANTEAESIVWLYNENDPESFPVFPADFAGFGGQITCAPEDSGIYIAVTERETGPDACMAYDTIRVTKLEAPEIDLPISDFICGGNQPITVGTDAIPDVNYEWFLDINEEPIAIGNETTFDEPGFYTLIATDNGGCSSSAMIAINSAPIDFNIQFTSGGMQLLPENDTVKVCGTNALTVTATSTDPTQLATYQWFDELGGEPLSGLPTFTINDNNDQMYYVEYTHFNSGCTNLDSFNVQFEVPPIITLEDITICQGQDFVIDTELIGLTHIWVKDNVELTNETTNQIIIDDGGTYFVGAFQIDENCISTKEFNVSTIPSPTVLPLDDESICSGELTPLEVIADGDYDYQWFIDGEVIIGANENVIEVDSGGFYEVIVTASGQCRDTLQSVVNESFIDGLNLGDEDIALCPGESITLTPLDGEFANYIWSTGEDTPSITLEAGDVDEITVQEISLIVDNGDGCVLTDNINVINFPVISAEINTDVTELCPTDSLELIATGGLFYTWTEGGSTLNQVDTAFVVGHPTVTTTYVVEVRDACPDNFDTDTLTVQVWPEAMISAGVDTCAFANLQFDLEATGGVEYIWSPGDVIQGSNEIANPTINIDEPTTFLVTITDEFGCVYTDAVEVCIRDNAESLIDIVTIITPNGDGKNDQLVFNGLDAYPTNKLTIWNQWGNVVFTALNYQRNGENLFDGTNGIDELPASTYYYVLEFNGLFIKEALTITRD